MVKIMSRVLRASSFFAGESRQWQVGITLVAVSVVDRLHWGILGRRGKTDKANLHAMVDPKDSIVGEAIQALLNLLDGWLREAEWGLLEQLGLPSVDASEPRRFARNTVLRLSAGLFQRTEKWPYRLQFLVSPNVSTVVKAMVAQALIDARPCCVGAFARAFRKHFPTVSEVRSKVATTVLLSWQQQQRFSSAPVECVHKQAKDIVASGTSGAAHAPAAYQAVCKLLHQAHLHRGGSSMALTSAKKKPLLAAETHGYCWPALPGPQPLQQLVGVEQQAGATGARPVDARRGRQTLAVVSSLDDHSMSKLGGGNPKVMYINHQIQVASSNRTLSKADVQDLRRQHVAVYDSNPVVRERWGKIYQAVRRKKQLQAAAPQLRSSSTGASSGLWPGHMQQISEIPERLVASVALLKEFYESEYNSKVQHLEERSKDGSKFQLVPRDVHPNRDRPALSPLGCAGEPHNLCTASLSAQGFLAKVERAQVLLNQWFRSLPKDEVLSCELVSLPRGRRRLLHVAFDGRRLLLAAGPDIRRVQAPRGPP